MTWLKTTNKKHLCNVALINVVSKDFISKDFISIVVLPLRYHSSRKIIGKYDLSSIQNVSEKIFLLLNITTFS